MDSDRAVFVDRFDGECLVRLLGIVNLTLLEWSESAFFFNAGVKFIEAFYGLKSTVRAHQITEVGINCRLLRFAIEAIMDGEYARTIGLKFESRFGIEGDFIDFNFTNSGFDFGAAGQVDAQFS